MFPERFQPHASNRDPPQALTPQNPNLFRDAPIILSRAEAFGDHAAADLCVLSLAENFPHVSAAEWMAVQPSYFLRVLRCETDLTSQRLQTGAILTAWVCETVANYRTDISSCSDGRYKYGGTRLDFPYEYAELQTLGFRYFSSPETLKTEVPEPCRRAGVATCERRERTTYFRRFWATAKALRGGQRASMQRWQVRCGIRSDSGDATSLLPVSQRYTRLATFGWRSLLCVPVFEVLTCFVCNARVRDDAFNLNFQTLKPRHMSLEMLASAARNEGIPSRLVLEGVMARSLSMRHRPQSPNPQSCTPSPSLRIGKI